MIEYIDGSDPENLPEDIKASKNSSLSSLENEWNTVIESMDLRKALDFLAMIEVQSAQDRRRIRFLNNNRKQTEAEIQDQVTIELGGFRQKVKALIDIMGR